MEISLTDEERAECDVAMEYIEAMSAWHDEEIEGGTKLDFALRILEQIDRRGRLDAHMRAWCDQRVRALYSS